MASVSGRLRNALCALLCVALTGALVLSGPARAHAAQDDATIDEVVQDALVSCVDGLLRDVPAMSADEAVEGAGSAASAGQDATEAAEGATASPEILSSDVLDPADGTGAWLAYDLLRAGVIADEADRQTYQERIDEFVTASYAGDQKGLDAYSPTTWARTAVALAAFGGDPHAVGRTAAGAPADLLYDGLYNWSYTADVGDQGSNAYIYALQAIRACGATDVEGARYTTQDLLDGLLTCQADDGSFSLSPDSATGSVDLTGMALSALAGYANEPAVSAAIDRALAYLQDQQLKDGSFAAEGESSSESCAMVVVGLCALGVDPEEDDRFVKKKGTALSALLSFQKQDGTFAHVRDDDEDSFQLLPTEQALRALLAYEELRQGADGDIYTADATLDIPGVAVLQGDAAMPPSLSAAVWGLRLGSLSVGAVAGVIVVVVIWAVRRTRRMRRLRAEGIR